MAKIWNFFVILIVAMMLIDRTTGRDTKIVKLIPIYSAENSKSFETAKPSMGEKTIECGAEENYHVGTFTWMDYTVLIGMLVISLGIGVFYGFFGKKGEETSADFLLGSEMKLFPVTLSLTTSFITAIELLGNPSEMFFNGTQFTLIVLSMIIVIPVAIKFFYPLYMKHDITSCYEYLGIRFGVKLRIFGAILYIIQMSFYTAVAVLAPAIALSKATGLQTYLAVGLIYLVCIFYSSQGGLKAVVIADTFQAVVLALSLVLVLIVGNFYSGNIVDVFQTAHDNDRLEFFNFDPNPTTRHTVFSVVIGGFFYWTSMFCTNQACVQKCMSLRSLARIKKAIIFSVIGLIVVFIINFYTGLMVFKHYSSCDPLRSGEITAKDQLLPFYIMDVYGNIEFFTGIFVAGIFAASLGTVASALSTLAAVTSEDLLIGALNLKIEPKKMAHYAKWMSFGYGILSFGLVFIVEQLGGILQATLTLNGMIGGITLGLFSLGIFYKRANSTGTVIGGLIAFVIVVVIGVMAQVQGVETPALPTSIDSCNCYFNATRDEIEKEILSLTDESTVSPIFRISYMWYSFISTALTVIFGILFSWIVDCIEFYSENSAMNSKTEKDQCEKTEKYMKSAMESNNLRIIICDKKDEKSFPKLGNDNLAFEK